MDEIARHAGFGVGTVYRHFQTKEELFTAVMVSYKARLIEEAKKWLRHGNPGEAEAFPERIVSIICDGLRSKQALDGQTYSTKNYVPNPLPET